MLGKYRKASKKGKFGPKSTTLAAYSGVFLLVMTMVAIGYQSPQHVDSVANVTTTSTQTSEANQPSVDAVIATNVAAGIASRANLPIAPNIANQSVSLKIQSQLAQTDTNAIAKPQIVQPSANNRTVKQYTTVEGDTVTSVAAQFGVSADTIKWANNLTGDSISVGKELKVLPVDGIIYTAKANDTLESISDRYKTSVAAITVYNDLELTGLTDGKELIIPSGVLPIEDRPGYVAPRQQQSFTSSAGLPYGTIRYAGGYGGGNIQVINPYTLISSSRNIYRATNGGANGQCTWWAIERRAAIGRPLPGGALGNAADWVYSLSGRFAINQSPAVGAVIQNGGGYGHVGVVESLNADGSITISEMNNYSAGGAFAVDLRVIPASAVGNFNYIH